MLTTIEDSDKSLTTVRNRSLVTRRTELSREVVPTFLEEGQHFLPRHQRGFQNTDPGYWVNLKYGRSSDGRTQRVPSG